MGPNLGLGFRVWILNWGHDDKDRVSIRRTSMFRVAVSQESRRLFAFQTL